jgi:hypothetical protein
MSTRGSTRKRKAPEAEETKRPQKKAKKAQDEGAKILRFEFAGCAMLTTARSLLCCVGGCGAEAQAAETAAEAKPAGKKAGPFVGARCRFLRCMRSAQEEVRQGQSRQVWQGCQGGDERGVQGRG